MARGKRAIAAVAAFLLIAERAAAADEASCATVTRSNVVPCAVAASLSTKAESSGLLALDGRRRAASVVLPANPNVAIAGAHPIESGLTERPALWSATLSQEIEIAGQRGARLDIVSAEQRAQRARVALARRDAAADALLLYFDALAAAEEARLADRLATLASSLTAVAQGRLETGVGAGVEAELATAIATRLLQGQLTAQQRRATANAALASALGLNPATAKLRVEGDLRPLAIVDAGPALAERAVAQRGEIAAALAERESLEHRVSLYERLRWPNPTLSVFARNDWIGERSIGLGVGIPIPLPAPIGRTYAGEIAEGSALAQRADTEAERLRRLVRLQVVTALETVASRKRQADLYPPQQVQKSEDTVRSIGEAIAAGRLPVRDALLMQQGLIDYLFGHVEARRQLCFASVELARAAGLPLEEKAAR